MGTHYNHIQDTERDELASLLSQGFSCRAIGQMLGRSHTSISREVQRNGLADEQGYRALAAAQVARERTSVSNTYERLRKPGLRTYVREHLKEGWSPEQIASAIKQDESLLSVSHEAIYQWVYTEEPELIVYLRRKHRNRYKRGFSRKRKKQMIPSRIGISERPEAANQREEPGHWETDLIVCNASQSALNVTLERMSRKVFITKVPNRKAEESFKAIRRRLRRLPAHMRRSITYDNGSENMQHMRLNLALGTKSYFCAPYHSWEKGAVENINGLIREYVPRGSDIARLSKNKVETIERRLNNRPRKCLGFRTPEQVFEMLLSGALHG